MTRERWLVWYRHSFDGPITERMIAVVPTESAAIEKVAQRREVGELLGYADTCGYRKLSDGEKPGP